MPFLFRSNYQLESAELDEVRKSIADMRVFLLEQPTAITEYDEQLVRRLIEKVTVHEDPFTGMGGSYILLKINSANWPCFFTSFK